MYHDIENNEIVTREQLMLEYADKVQDGEINAEEMNLYEYIENCQTRHNGTLESIDEYFRRMDARFDDFLCDRIDEIDGAALELLSMLAGRRLEWDANLVSFPIDAAESILRESGNDACYPYYCDENRVPCYRSGTCQRATCLFTGMKMIGEDEA